MIERFVKERPIFVGSSMGGWISLLAARHLMETRPDIAPAGIVLIAPAVDMTERLMWERFPEELRRSVQETGVYHRPSAYSDDPYPITWKLIEDGRRHLLLGQPIKTGCPVHILQGMEDPDVPWSHALQLVEHLPGDSVSLTLIKDGDHRLSRPEDIERLIAAVAASCLEEEVVSLVQAHRGQVMRPGIGDRRVAVVGQQDGLAAGGYEREELHARLKLRRLREQPGDLVGLHRLHIGHLAQAQSSPARSHRRPAQRSF